YRLAQAPARRRGGRLQGRRPSIPTGERALPGHRGAPARARNAPRDLPPHCPVDHGLFAPGGRQSADRIARRAHRDPGPHAGARRRLHRAARRRARELAAGAFAPAGRRVHVGQLDGGLGALPVAPRRRHRLLPRSGGTPAARAAQARHLRRVARIDRGAAAGHRRGAAGGGRQRGARAGAFPLMAAPAEAMAGRLPAWRVRLARLWSWWSGEIAQAARERFAVLRGSAAVPLVALDGSEVIVLEPPPAAGSDSHLDLATFDEPRRRAAFRALLERAGETNQRVRLRLAAGEALMRRVTMPLATEENLREVLGFEMDRLTPFRAEDVYYDYRVVSRDAAAGQLVAQVALARRELVDARLATLRSLGANVQAVVVRDDVGRGTASLDLLPTDQRGERESATQRRTQGALVAAAAVLLALALLIPVWKKRETVIALHPLVAKAQQDAEATDRLAKGLERQVNDYNFLLAKKY